MYPEYIKNFNYLTVKRQKYFYGEKVWTYLYKKDIQMTNNHIKNAQYHYSLVKCKLKPENTISHNVARIKMAGNKYWQTYRESGTYIWLIEI